jgi:hypothetical protein
VGKKEELRRKEAEVNRGQGEEPCSPLASGGRF